MKFFPHGKKPFWFSVLLGCAQSGFASAWYNMPEGVTSVSHEIYQLHMTIFWVCVVIGIGVFSVMFYALVRHRKSKGAVAAQFHEHLWVEILWTLIPFFILVAMAIPATRVLMRIEDHSDAEVNIKITGYQWKWRYDYLDEGFGFMSSLATPNEQIHNQSKKGEWYLLEVDNPVVVPIHRKIRFLITANDVIHSWWVPELGIKRDGVPGFIHESWARIEKPGTYRGQCAELCGMQHGFMPIVVIAKTEAEYDQWVQQQRQTAHLEGPSSSKPTVLAKTLNPKELMALGETNYLKYCATCHQPTGSGLPPAFPALQGSPIATGPVAGTLEIVLKGHPGTAMQAFGPQLSDLELASIVTYIRNMWNNNNQTQYGKAAGGVTQPLDVEHARQR